MSSKTRGGEKTLKARPSRHGLKDRDPSERLESAFLDGKHRYTGLGGALRSSGWGSDERPAFYADRGRLIDEGFARDAADLVPMSTDEERSGIPRHLSPEEIQRHYSHVNGKIKVPPEKRWGAYVKCLLRRARAKKHAQLIELIKNHGGPRISSSAACLFERVPESLVLEIERLIAHA